MTQETHFDKGGLMEEVLRIYFLSIGYYALRGVRYIYRGDEVTDIDIWLYKRSGLFSRQRFNVDVKNRNKSRALERILWAKGLQNALKLDGSIVATTDSRDEVSAFGELQGITILNGRFLSKLKSRFKNLNGRISEEDLVSMIRSDKNQISAVWLERYSLAKSRLATRLDFDSFNLLLNDVRYFVEQIFIVPHRGETICRILYLILSCLLIVIDFLVKDFTFAERDRQIATLNEGFRYGTSGRNGAERMFKVAAALVNNSSKVKRTKYNEYVSQLRQAAEGIQVEILTEFVIKNSQGTALFDLAKFFEESGYERNFIPPISLNSELKSFMATLLDFLDIDRKLFFKSVKDNATVSNPSASSGEETKPDMNEVESFRSSEVKASDVVDSLNPQPSLPLDNPDPSVS